MKRQKLKTVCCILLSIVFSVALGLFIHFKLFWPIASSVYEKCLYYPETLYEEYEKEAERMIEKHEYTCQYPAKTTLYSENGQTTLIIQIGEYDNSFKHSNYITATVKNYGTNEQEVTFSRSRESAKDAYEDAEEYKKLINIFIVMFIITLVIFTAYLIANSIKGHHGKVISIIITIIAGIAGSMAILKFLSI